MQNDGIKEPLPEFVYFPKSITEQEWAEEISKEVIYDYERQQFFIYEPISRHWNNDPSEYVKTKEYIKAKINKIRTTFATQYPKQQENIEQLNKWIKDSKINNIIEALKYTNYISIEQLRNKNKEYLHFNNGKTLSLNTGQIEETQKEHYAIYSLNCNYDPDSKAQRFDMFLQQIFKDNLEKIKFIRLWLGYCLLNDNPEQKFLIATGEGANGKSVLFDTVCSILGDYSRVAQFSLFEESKIYNESGQPFRVALADARAIFVQESSNYTVLNTAFVKQITGDDPISTRLLYSNKILQFKMSAKITFICNHLPFIHDDSNAIWRRILLLNFKQSFIGKEDINLKEKLYQERSGIMNFLIDGLCEYKVGQRLEMLSEEKDNLEQYYKESNNWELFVEEMIDINKDSFVTIKDLYDAYVNYCKECNYSPMSKVRFIRLICRKYNLALQIGRGNVRYISGIKLKNITADELPNI